MDILETITTSRIEARKVGDPNADIAFLALSDQSGMPSVRTLVLREIRDNRFQVFLNQTSPKWRLLEATQGYELLLWFGSQQRQFRIQGDISQMDPDIIQKNWQRRPAGSKLLDYVYKEFAPQSSEIASREDLTNEIARLRSSYNVDDMQAPKEALGIELIAQRIEMLNLTSEDRIHDRRLFKRDKANGTWKFTYLVP